VRASAAVLWLCLIAPALGADPPSVKLPERGEIKVRQARLDHGNGTTDVLVNVSFPAAMFFDPIYQWDPHQAWAANRK
jgi:hypothetical protein